MTIKVGWNWISETTQQVVLCFWTGLWAPHVVHRVDCFNDCEFRGSHCHSPRIRSCTRIVSSSSILDLCDIYKLLKKKLLSDFMQLKTSYRSIPYSRFEIEVFKSTPDVLWIWSAHDLVPSRVTVLLQLVHTEMLTPAPRLHFYKVSGSGGKMSWEKHVFSTWRMAVSSTFITLV